MEKPWSERVKLIRAKLDLTQAELANELLCHRNTIALWEMSDKPPRSVAGIAFVELEKEVLAFQAPEVVPEPEWEG